MSRIEPPSKPPVPAVDLTPEVLHDSEVPAKPIQQRRAGVVEVQRLELKPRPWVVDCLNAVKEATYGVVRADICRPFSVREREYQSDSWGSRPSVDDSYQRATWGAARNGYRDTYRDSYREEQGLLRSVGAGARLKVTRNCGGGRVLASGRQMFDLGIGLNCELDAKRIHPVLRLKIADAVALHLTPEPAIKVKRGFRIGNTGIVARIDFRAPVAEIATAVSSPAHVMVRFDYVPGKGIHFRPDGVEFSEKQLVLSESVAIKAAGMIKFPRQLPPPRDAAPLDWRLDQLGIKVRW